MKKILEYKEFGIHTSISDEELMEMANISPKKTGIKDVVIWIGPNPGNHWKRIKVSNIPNKISKTDCFILTIPDFKIIGEVNDKLITSSILEDIKKFININLQLIYDFSDEKITTDEFIDSLLKI